MKRFEFQLRISANEYLQYYRGNVNQVVARCTAGATIQFPAALLQPFISESGIRGHFVLTCDDEGRGAALARLQSAA